jgi:hypothetical protein
MPKDTGRGQVRQVVSASTPPCLASPTSMRPATRHHVILRGPPLQGRERPRRWRRLCRHADEASGPEVSRPASPLPCNLSFLATSRILPARSSAARLLAPPTTRSLAPGRTCQAPARRAPPAAPTVRGAPSSWLRSSPPTGVGLSACPAQAGRHEHPVRAATPDPFGRAHAPGVSRGSPVPRGHDAPSLRPSDPGCRAPRTRSSPPASTPAPAHGLLTPPLLGLESQAARGPRI